MVKGERERMTARGGAFRDIRSVEEARKQKEEPENIRLQSESQRAVPPKRGPHGLLYHPSTTTGPPPASPAISARHPDPRGRLRPISLKRGTGSKTRKVLATGTDQRESRRGGWAESRSCRHKPSGPACPLSQMASRAGLSVCPPGVSLCRFLSRALPLPACPGGGRARSETREGSF